MKNKASLVEGTVEFKDQYIRVYDDDFLPEKIYLNSGDKRLNAVSICGAQNKTEYAQYVAFYIPKPNGGGFELRAYSWCAGYNEGNLFEWGDKDELELIVKLTAHFDGARHWRFGDEDGYMYYMPGYVMRNLMELITNLELTYCSEGDTVGKAKETK